MLNGKRLEFLAMGINKNLVQFFMNSEAMYLASTLTFWTSTHFAALPFMNRLTKLSQVLVVLS